MRRSERNRRYKYKYLYKMMYIFSQFSQSKCSDSSFRSPSLSSHMHADGCIHIKCINEIYTMRQASCALVSVEEQRKKACMFSTFAFFFFASLSRCLILLYSSTRYLQSAVGLQIQFQISETQTLSLAVDDDCRHRESL